MKGPFRKTVEIPAAGYNMFRGYQEWYTSGKPPPFVEPHPYKRNAYWVDSTNDWHRNANRDGSILYQTVSTDQWCYSNVGASIIGLENLVYAKFLDAVREAPAVGTDLAEYRETLGLLSAASRALRHPLQNLSLACWREGNKLLRDASKYKWKSIAEIPLNLMPKAWLAFHFGVEPIIKDVYALVEYICSPPKPQKIEVKKSLKTKYSMSSRGQTQDFSYKLGVKFSAEVERVNENLALMSDFGLVNPASIAWELIPFSFVVDWLYPVGQLIASTTDLLGYQIRNPQRVRRVKAEGTETFVYPAVMPNYSPSVATFGCFRFERDLIIISVKLQRFKLPEKVSAVRGFTAISLLLMQELNILRKRKSEIATGFHDDILWS